MGILKFASSDTTRLDLGEGDFVEVRRDMSKRQFNELMSKMPNREISEENGLTLQEGLEFQQALFEALVVGWSVPEDPTVENYLQLGRAGADAIDTALINHFNEITPSETETGKAQPSRSRRPKEAKPLPRI